MPKKAIIDPLGNLQTEGLRFSIYREPERWRVWLDQGRPFRFQGLHVDGHAVNLYSVRAKIIKGHRFWYAERKQQGRTRTVYLGKADALTLNRLRWAIARLREAPQYVEKTIIEVEKARAVEA